MAQFNGNNPYLQVGGVDLAPYFVQFDITYTQNGVEVTSGGNSTSVERAAGLNDYSGTMTIVYDDADIATYETAMQPGVKTLDYGPESNGAGDPEHTQSIHINSVSVSQRVSKDLMAFTINWSGAAAPTKSILNGDTF